MRRTSVTVIGGGIAGLSAAVRLAAAGCRVTVLEKRSVAGGRASSFQDDEGWIDNCQHVLLGCCTQLLEYYRTVGVERQIEFYDTLHFLDPAGSRFTLGAARLPAPFHLAPGILRFRALPFRRRLGVVRALARLRRKVPPDDSFLSWLHEQGETGESLRLFWDPVVVSALNASLDRVACRHAFHLFRAAFLSNRHGYRVGIPKVPLAELYTGPAAAFLEAREGRLMLGLPVEHLLAGSSGIEAAVVKDRQFRSDYFISSLPPKRLLRLLPEDRRFSTWAEPFKGFEYSPILSAHFWLAGASFDLPFITVLGKNVQWVFNRTRLLGGGAQGVLHLEAVISAATKFARLRQEEIFRILWEEIRQIVGIRHNQSLQRWRIVREAEATWIPDGRSVGLRPGSASPLANFFLAGDWVETGWPATMESAAISGFKAAQAILERIPDRVPGTR
jgi:squalene-associated FAD-dependent desaturase